MSKPTKDDLLEFMKKHKPERVDSITDKDSAIKHFRTTSKLYKQQRDGYKNERDTLIDDIAVLKANISRLERENDQLKHQLKGTREFFVDVTKRSEKQLELLKDFSKFINYKLVVCPANDSYKHYRSELDKLGIK